MLWMSFESQAACHKGSLPEKVYLKSPTLTYNKKYYFGIDQGHLCFKPKKGPRFWQPMNFPTFLYEVYGTLQEISVDGDTLIAIGQYRNIYKMLGADDGDFDRFKWKRGKYFSWGSSSSSILPNRLQETQVFFASSSRDDLDKLNPGFIGLFPEQGTEGLISLRSGQPEKIIYSSEKFSKGTHYEISGPEFGKLKIAAIRTSGLALFVLGQNGEFYVRQLPGLDWVQLPKVPGEFTSLLSIEEDQDDEFIRILRVEGKSENQNGYYELSYDSTHGLRYTRNFTTEPQDLNWAFVPTDPPLQKEIFISDPSSTAYVQGDVEDFQTVLKFPLGVELSLERFSSIHSKMDIIVKFPSKESLSLIVNTYNPIRPVAHISQKWKKKNKEQLYGTLEIPDETRQRLDHLSPSQQRFLKIFFGGEEKVPITVDFTAETVHIRHSLSAYIKSVDWMFHPK
jgi:hypothetical protein